MALRQAQLERHAAEPGDLNLHNALPLLHLAVALARAEALAARTATVAPPSSPAYPAGLSAREVEALRLLARGLQDQETASEPSISVTTVHKHVASILGKTGSQNRTAAAAFAHQHGLA